LAGQGVSAVSLIILAHERRNSPACAPLGTPATTVIPTFYLVSTTGTPSHKLPIVVIAQGIIVVLIAALVVEVLFCRWLARRKWRPASTRITITAGVASLVGPACAVLPYTDYWPDFSFALAVVWLLAAIGGIGIGIGVFAFNMDSKVAGAICVLTNIPVLAYWGFIGAFFSMGGSK
jgi:hypothetical protein